MKERVVLVTPTLFGVSLGGARMIIFGVSELTVRFLHVTVEMAVGMGVEIVSGIFGERIMRNWFDSGISFPKA